jgi:heptosyltransferase-2
MAVMLNPSKIFNMVTFLAGIPVRVGYNRKCSFLLTHKIEDKKFEGLKHEVEYNLDLVGLVDAKVTSKEISLPIRKTDLEFINELLGKKINEQDKLIAVHPWTSDKNKRWPLKNFIQLINILTGRPDTKVVIIGGKENKESIAEEHFNNEQSVINLAGELTLRQVSALFTRCLCLISGDSGPVHLAAASGLKAIVLFRSRPAAVSAVRWGPWGNKHIIIEKDDLSDISVEEVINRVGEIS